MLKTGVHLIMGYGIVISSFALKSRTFHAWDLLIVLDMIMTAASNWLVNMNCLVMPLKTLTFVRK